MIQNYSSLKKRFPFFYDNKLRFCALVILCLLSFSTNVIAQADLSITKSVSNDTPDVGDIIIFTLRVTNNGPDVATGVRIQDIVATGYGDITNISNGGAALGNNINWNNLTVPVTSSTNPPLALTLTVTVLPNGEYNNRAQITASDQIDPDSDPSEGFDDLSTPDVIENDDLNDGIADDDESNLVVVTPRISDLSITKEVDNLEPNKGTEVQFTITVENNGISIANNVSVRDQLPEGFIWVSDDSFGDYNPATGIWTIGDVEEGTPATLNITAVVSLIDAYTNTAEIISSDSFDRDPSNNIDSITLDPIGLLIPEGFSPNGDNINETFEIPGLGFLYPNFKMEIFNRYGNRVFNYSNEGKTEPQWWNGFSDGRLTVGSKNSLPTGTYYYILYFNQDNLEPLTNWIYLNR